MGDSHTGSFFTVKVGFFAVFFKVFDKIPFSRCFSLYPHLPLF